LRPTPPSLPHSAQQLIVASSQLFIPDLDFDGLWRIKRPSDHDRIGFK
jgi:hypothetical protein